MNRKHLKRILASSVLIGLMLLPHAAKACAACYGKSDSDLARGFNWGVFTLLGVVGCVLGGFVAFFIYLAKRSAAMSQNQNVVSLPETTQNA
jgi:hypothetical protein